MVKRIILTLDDKVFSEFQRKKEEKTKKSKLSLSWEEFFMMLGNIK